MVLHTSLTPLVSVIEIFNLTGPKIYKGNLIWTPWNFQMAVSRRRNKIFKIRWCQNSRIVQAFHPLFHESDVTPLFHALSASFLKETTLSGCSTVQKFSEKWSEHAPVTIFQVGKKKFTWHPTTFFCRVDL